MKLVELSMELARAQMMRRSVAGVMPRILSLTFDTMDEIGKVFSARAVFTFGNDFTCEIELDAAADLSSGDWPARLDAAIFCDGPRWVQ